MREKKKFNVNDLKGKLGILRDEMKKYNLPPRVLLILLGVISTIWFLVRVIPKPSRAAYPCMRVAAPFMSSLVLYLLAVGGITVLSRKSKRIIINIRLASTALLIFSVIVTMAIIPTDIIFPLYNGISSKTGPDDGPNEPMGIARGVMPGRVVWAWDPDATNENTSGLFAKPENTDFKVAGNMVSESVKKLTGMADSKKAWDAMFRNFNKTKKNIDKGYSDGEKVFIKINQMTARSSLSEEDQANGYYITSNRPGLGTLQTGSAVVLEVIRQLVNEAGVNQEDIAIGDPQNHVFGHNSDAWTAEFPDIVIIDKLSSQHGRTIIKPSEEALMFYSDKRQTDRFWDVVENADYMINVASLKPHLRAGMSLTAKNHFGTHSRPGAYHLHYSLVAPIRGGMATNSGYKKYRVLTDIMGSKYLGQNTILTVVDGLFGGGTAEGGPPVKYHTSPFNYDWCNSIFMSQDQVALESVCYDFLRNEWDGSRTHDSENNRQESALMLMVNGVDDYLHQAADSENWPDGFVYDPDNSGKPIPSLGVHEHWNSPDYKQYSRNIGKPYGIEFVSIPDDLVGRDAPKSYPGISNSEIQKKNSKEITNPPASSEGIRRQQLVENTVSIGDNSLIKSVQKRSFNEGFEAKKFYAGIIDDNNGKLFLTEAGVTYGRRGYSVYNQNSKIPTSDLWDIKYELSNEGPKLWIASPNGAVLAALPIDSESHAEVINSKNSKLLSDSVFTIAVGNNGLKWFGTNKGISALYKEKWLSPDFEIEYPLDLFELFPLTSLATSINGDSLYVGTIGFGVARLYRNDVDGISGASPYANWETIEMPSDNVYSICIAPDGTQWFGTDEGIARHTGTNTLKNWTVFTAEDGLVNNFVQTIAVDLDGRIWFGTKGGISVFNGSSWASLTMKDGLISDNILDIMVDNQGYIYIGTDNGLMIYDMGELVCYQ